MELSIIRRRLRLDTVALNRVRQRFCVDDEEDWDKHRALWDTVGKARDFRDVIINDDRLCSLCQIRRKPGECSTRDAIHVFKSSVVSKAAERSESVKRKTLPESSAKRMSIVELKRAVFKCYGEGGKRIEKNR